MILARRTGSVSESRQQYLLQVRYSWPQASRAVIVIPLVGLCHLGFVEVQRPIPPVLRLDSALVSKVPKFPDDCVYTEFAGVDPTMPLGWGTSEES